jgi:hypothetical protein
MATTNEPRGLYNLITLVMVAILAADFCWVFTTALHAMKE